MGLRGPPATRGAQRRGGLGDLAVSARAPDPGRIPRTPPDLAPETRRLWRNAWRSPVGRAWDRASDFHLVTRWIRDVDRFETISARYDLALETGLDGEGPLSPGFLGRELHKAAGRISTAELQLGMTPLARERLGLTAGQSRIAADSFVAPLESNRPDPVELLPSPAEAESGS